jgi:LmbE family N-acetylglucosaminyl deacetylase
LKRVLVISPHPDDESIGCGGTLRAHVLAGDRVEVVFLTSGEAGGHGKPPDETARIREAEARAAGNILGVRAIDFWRQPDSKLRVTAALIERLRAKLKHFRPHTIYVTHDREMLGDHMAAARLVKQALANFSNGSERPEVLMFEVWTPLQQMDHIVDISRHVRTKQRAIRAYQSQCEVMSFDEAALALNRYRGEMHSWPGGDYAEIFKYLKI